MVSHIKDVSRECDIPNHSKVASPPKLLAISYSWFAQFLKIPDKVAKHVGFFMFFLSHIWGS